MSRILSYVYGAAAYVLFLGTFLYAIGFVGNLFVPKTIDSGPQSGLVTSLLINTVVLLAFAVQHSVMARPWFKRWWTRFVPRPIERSTFVVFSSLALILLYWQWRPLPAEIWSLEGTAASLMVALFWAGWGIVLLSTFMISHFHLFGLTQVHTYFLGREAGEPHFEAKAFYRLVRHPIMLGFIIAFWATPHMTAGHLLFAVATTGYILVALQFEERDLLRMFGRTYERYRKEVRMLVPLPRRAPSVTDAGVEPSRAGEQTGAV